MKRALALVLIAGCSTTRVSVRGGELHRHLHELRTTGHATVEAITTRDDATDGTATRREVRLDQSVVFDRETHPIVELAKNCPDEAGDTRIEGCSFSMFRDERFTIHSERHFQPGTAGLVALGTGLFVGYGAMAYCAWNCEGKAAGVSFAGLGVWAVLTVVLAVAQRRARNH